MMRAALVTLVCWAVAAFVVEAQSYQRAAR